MRKWKYDLSTIFSKTQCRRLLYTKFGILVQHLLTYDDVMPPFVQAYIITIKICCDTLTIKYPLVKHCLAI